MQHPASGVYFLLCAMDPFFGFIAFLLVVACVLLWPLVNSFRRAPAEKGLQPIWQQRCTVGFRRFGIGGTTSLFTRVSLYSDLMIMRGFSTTVIPYKNIAEVAWKQNFLSLGGVLIRLHGLKSSYVLYPRGPKTFVDLVESHLTSHSRGTGYASPSI